MTNITLNHLEPQLAQCLRQRAAHNGRTVEAEIIATLTEALQLKEEPQSQPIGLGTTIRQRFAHVGEFSIPEIQREPIRNPPIF